jgi:hypothetical protein
MMGLKRTPPALARTLELGQRVQTDLRLLADGTRAADVPFLHLAKVRRAQTEIKNLLRDLGEVAHVEK